MKNVRWAVLLLAGTGLVNSTAFAADPVAEYSHDWSGIYIGLNAGGVWGSERASTGCGVVTDINDEGNDAYSNLCEAGDDVYYDGLIENDSDDGPNAGLEPVMMLALDEYSEAIGFISEELDANNGGWFGGAQVGFNRQYDDFVFGLELGAHKFSGIENKFEAEFDFFQDVDDDVGDDNRVLDDYEATGEAHFNSQLDWLTKATARVGMSFMDEGKGLGYLTGGLAVAHVSASADSSFTDPTDSDSDGTCWLDEEAEEGARCGVKNRGDDFYQFGFVVGGGVEYALTRNVSLGAEYNYIKLYGGQTLTSDFSASDGTVWTYEYEAGYDDIHTVGVKLNYRFD